MGNSMDMSRIVSDIWKCFEEISIEKAQCCVCGVCLPRIYQNEIEQMTILQEHMKKIHNIRCPIISGDEIESTRFNCTKCDFYTPIRRDLKEHMKIIHPRMYVWNNFTKISSEVIKCNHCDKIYTRNKSMIEYIHTAQMRKHLEKKHKEKLPEDLQKEDFAKCEFCDKEFHYDSQRKKKVHEIRYHKKEEMFICQDCGKGFARKWDRVKHERIHTGFKPYLCNFCAKSFTTSSLLKQHSTVHTNETPFQCSKCEKFFKFASTRSSHKCIQEA